MEAMNKGIMQNNKSDTNRRIARVKVHETIGKLTKRLKYVRNEKGKQQKQHDNSIHIYMYNCR